MSVSDFALDDLSPKFGRLLKLGLLPKGFLLFVVGLPGFALSPNDFALVSVLLSKGFLLRDGLLLNGLLSLTGLSSRVDHSLEVRCGFTLLLL